MVRHLTKLLLAAALTYGYLHGTAIADYSPSPYTFATTKQTLVDTEVGRVGKIVGSAQSYIEKLQGPRGLNIGLLCLICATLTYFINMRGATYAFGSAAIFCIMINKPFIGMAILVPLMLWKQSQLKDPQNKLVQVAKNGDELPGTVKERTTKDIPKLNPMSDPSVAPAQAIPATIKISRPL